MWPFGVPCMHPTDVLLTCRIAQLMDLHSLRREASNLVPKLIAVLQPIFAAGDCVHTVLQHKCTLYAICMHFGVALQSCCEANPAVTLYSSQLHCCCCCLKHQKRHKGLLSSKILRQSPVYSVSSIDASFTHTRTDLNCHSPAMYLLI